MSASYDYWARALAITGGKRPLTREEMSGLGISEDEIGCGFFRVRAVPRGPFVAKVAIWENVSEGIVAIQDGVQVSDAVWLAACKFPITEEEYRTEDEGVPA